MSEKKIIHARPSSPALEEFVLECIAPHVQKLMKCSADDLTSLANDLFDPDMDLSDIPLPSGQDYRNAPVGYIIALSTVMGEFLNAQKALGGDTTTQVHKLRARRSNGETIGRWRPRTDQEIQ